MLGIITLLLWAALIGCAELAAGFLTALLRRLASWVTEVSRLIGGLALLGFSTWVYARWRFIIHPTSLSPLIGGTVLIWKAASLPLSALTSSLTASVANTCRFAFGVILVAASLSLWRAWPYQAHPALLSLLLAGVALLCKGGVRPLAY